MEIFYSDNLATLNNTALTMFTCIKVGIETPQPKVVALFSKQQPEKL